MVEGDDRGFLALQEERGALDICSELWGALSQIDGLELGLNTRVADLTERFEEWEGDNVSNLMLLNDKIKELKTTLATATPHQGTVSISFSTPITDENGDRIGELGDFLSDMQALKAENVALQADLGAIKADLKAQGGIVFGQQLFTSESQLVTSAMLECPQGDAFALFVDPVSIFCHDAPYNPCTGWQKDTKDMADSGYMAVSDRKVVASYDCTTPFWFAEGKQVIGGEKMASFASPEKWSGEGGMIGRREQIENSAEAACDRLRQAIRDKLPLGGKLSELAIKMMDHTHGWYQKLHKHLDSELDKLKKMGISQANVLVLLSEEVIIIFERFNTIRRKRMDFRIKDNRVEYMVRCIWLALQVHVQMDEFMRDGLKYNSAISAAFVRFLTTQTGKKGDLDTSDLESRVKKRRSLSERGPQIGKGSYSTGRLSVHQCRFGQEQFDEAIRQQLLSKEVTVLGGGTKRCSHFRGPPSYRTPQLVCGGRWRLAGRPDFPHFSRVTSSRGLLPGTPSCIL